MEFTGIVKPRRRGGWIARGVIVEQRFGQIVETQIGPREFADESASLAWLSDAAAQLGFGQPKIATMTNSGR